MLFGTGPGVVHVERYWLPIGNSYSLTAAGWLADPGDNRFYTANANAVTTTNLASGRCVVLLGEPGMGKTSAVRAHGPLLPPHTAAKALEFDLGRYSSEERLARRVFENAEITAWAASSNTLCLTLDAFDEAHSRVNSLHRMLAEYLDSWDCDRLLLRIVCRTADWPVSLRSSLDRQFGQVDVCELLPLRRRDAATLLSAAGVDAQTFLSTVEAAHVVPLAARPLTLDLLRAAMRPDGTLPDHAAELYARGLLTLADEMNAARRDATRSTSGPADHLAVATRMAAISVFGGRPTIWTGPIAQADPTDLTVDDCIRSATGTRLRTFSTELVEATLRTGLFTGAGENRLGWSHATFADYLSARWIITSELSEHQVRSILLAQDGGIHARVRQVAAWLVAIAPDVFRWLIPCDPEAFLSSVDIPAESLRRELVAALLTDAQAGRLYDDFTLDLSNLGHSELAEQLRVALDNSSRSVLRIAISIARQCQVLAIVPELIALALYAATDPDIQVSAAMTVHDLSTDQPSHQLVTLLGSSSSPSVDESSSWELEAAALMASWPHAISTSEVFELLNPRYPRNHFGLYSIFISDFAKRLTHNDLAIACDWLSAEPDRLSDSRLTTLINAVVRLCLKHLDEPKAREAVRQVALRRADDYDSLFSDETFAGEPELAEDDRRAIARLLFEDASDHQVLSIVDTVGGRGLSLITTTDLGWLIEQYASADGTLKKNVATAINYLYNPEDVAQSEQVLGLADDHPAAVLFSYWRSVIMLDSPEATAARNLWREHAEHRERLARRRSDLEGRSAWVNPRIRDDAEKAKSGDIQAFWNAVRLVTVRPGTQHHMNEFQPDLTAHPRWATLPNQTRQDLIDAAPVYLRNGRCEPDRWLTQGKDYFPAQAAYRALLLLLRERPEQLDELPGDVWKEWAPIMVSWTATINGAQAQDKRALFKIAVPHARDELTSALLTLIDVAIAAGQHTFLREELALLDSDALAHKLVERLRRPMDPMPRDDILNALMENHTELVRPLLNDWLGAEQRTENPERARRAVERLLHADPSHGWPLLRTLMDSDPDFMESAFLSIDHAYRRTPDLGESDIADLYIWLSRHFPADNDPQFDDVHRIGRRESLGSWRDSLLDGLRRLGTRDAVSAVERVVAVFPEKEWLNRVLFDAQRAYRDRTWQAVGPHELDLLADSHHSHLIRTDEDLFIATLHALEAVQARLQADTPSANLLWDTHSGRPKSEDEISDYISVELGRRLHRHGAVVNREVQVRRIKPSGLPERTDLRIEALPTRDGGSAGPILIPGEVKGAWNAGVIDSVESQLVNRYMADFQTNYGIYITIWFDIPSWTDADDGRRSKAAAHRGREHLLAALQKQAAEQLESGKRIAIVILDASLHRPDTAPPAIDGA